MKLVSLSSVSVLSCLLSCSTGTVLRGSVDVSSNSLSGCTSLTDRPIIGVFTQPEETQPEYEYIAGSYVKFLEAAGARVVPVRFSASEAELRYVFNSINGLLFPGGDNALIPGQPLYDAAEKLFRWALEANAKGDFFPVWGTCLGFELLHILAADNNVTVLEASGSYDAENYATPISFNENTKESELFSQLHPRIKHKLEREPITFNAHQAGIHPDMYQNEKLSSFFRDTATYVDRKGKPFVAAAEGRNVPVYAVQFHPEKNNFEWHVPSNIPHEPDAIYLSQYLADFFVSRARCNGHRFPGGFKEESERVIQASRTIYKVTPEDYFSEQYLF